MRRLIGGVLWLVFGVMLCGIIGGAIALASTPSLQQQVAPLVCREGETFTTTSSTCTDENGGTSTCYEFWCVNAQGQRRNVTGFMAIGIFLAIVPLIAVALLAGILSASGRSQPQVLMMPQGTSPPPTMRGNPAMGGKVLTIQGRGGPFVVQFERDSLSLDQKIAILEQAHDSGQLTDQQLGEAVDELTRIVEWGQ